MFDPSRQSNDVTATSSTDLVHMYREKSRKDISEATFGGMPTEIPEGIRKDIDVERTESSTEKEKRNDIDLSLPGSKVDSEVKKSARSEEHDNTLIFEKSLALRPALRLQGGSKNFVAFRVSLEARGRVLEAVAALDYFPADDTRTPPEVFVRLVEFYTSIRLECQRPL